MAQIHEAFKKIRCILCIVSKQVFPNFPAAVSFPKRLAGLIPYFKRHFSPSDNKNNVLQFGYEFLRRSQDLPNSSFPETSRWFPLGSTFHSLCYLLCSTGRSFTFCSVNKVPNCMCDHWVLCSIFPLCCSFFCYFYIYPSIKFFRLILRLSMQPG